MPRVLTPLPCPFCGESPVVWPKDDLTQGKGWATVTCRNSECPAKPSLADDLPYDPKLPLTDYQQSAIRRWNTRY
jgi:hypothetical protein